MKPSELIIQVRTLITDPSSFLQNGLAAQLANGASTPGDNPDACKFCILGAMSHVIGSSYLSSNREQRVIRLQAEDCITEVIKDCVESKAYIDGKVTIARYNDKMPHDVVLLALDSAAQLARSQE